MIRVMDENRKTIVFVSKYGYIHAIAEPFTHAYQCNRYMYIEQHSIARVVYCVRARLREIFFALIHQQPTRTHTHTHRSTFMAMAKHVLVAWQWLI